MKARASVWPSLAAPCSVWEGRLASNPSWARAAAFGLNCQPRRREQENAASEKPRKDESKLPGDDGWVPESRKKSKEPSERPSFVGFQNVNYGQAFEGCIPLQVSISFFGNIAVLRIRSHRKVGFSRRRRRPRNRSCL